MRDRLEWFRASVRTLLTSTIQRNCPSRFASRMVPILSTLHASVRRNTPTGTWKHAPARRWVIPATWLDTVHQTRSRHSLIDRRYTTASGPCPVFHERHPQNEPTMLDQVIYGPIIENAIREDLAGGDITTESTVELGAKCIAFAVARSPMVVCGGSVFASTFKLVDPTLEFASLVLDGRVVCASTALWRVEGSARSILAAERVALNFVQRMSGIATLTRAFVDAIPDGCKTRIADTRKTTPGIRYLERYAVRTGGGRNHRDCLGSAVLIKDNHIVAAGGIASALRRARAYAPHTSRIEIEVDSLSQFDEALAEQADVIMLDNFGIEEIKTAVRRAGGKAIIEVSGGVSVEKVRALALLGVDVISVGALTHSAPAADIGLDM